MDLSNLPRNPGCYLFRDASGKVIYVGKAKDLKKRVASYFQKKEHDPKTQGLVDNIDGVDFIVTNTEAEALILENNLIKENKPKYNIDLRDSKRYSYIELTSEDFPRLLIARLRKDGMYFGPFVSAEQRDYVITFLRRLFQIRTCKRMPKRPCLRHHIRLCSAPCAGRISKEDYGKRIDACKLILKGRVDELVKGLEGEMDTFSSAQDYERALEVRERIGALQRLSERQTMERQRKYDEDIINWKTIDGRVFLILFNVHKGILCNKQEFEFDYIRGFLEDFIVQYYSENPVPEEIILPEKINPVLIGFLEEKRGSRVRAVVPRIGEKRQLLELVDKNIEISFFGNITKVKALRKALKLADNPYVVECFDISHLSGTSTAGSMVQFRNGKPDKSNYRRFRIRTVEGVDDFAAISEVVRRRYSRLKQEDSRMPDLIIIDGGKGQLMSALKEINRLGLKIPIISIAKRLEEVYVPGLSFPINVKNSALLFIREVRDEAHRFAIAYNRLLRKKEL
ncbi:MAG: excinuclease ABC subunit UvrC [archaeon]